MNKLLNKAALTLMENWQYDGIGRRRRNPMLSDFIEHLEDTMPDWWLAHFFQRNDSEALLERELQKVLYYSRRYAS